MNERNEYAKWITEDLSVGMNQRAIEIAAASNKVIACGRASLASLYFIR
jgi:hypothetical protein